MSMIKFTVNIFRIILNVNVNVVVTTLQLQRYKITSNTQLKEKLRHPNQGFVNIQHSKYQGAECKISVRTFVLYSHSNKCMCVWCVALIQAKFHRQKAE